MPWTRRQVKKLLSSGSPLSDAQKESMKSELHANPAMGHAKKGSAALKKPRMVTTVGGYDFRQHMGGRRKGT